MRKILYILLPCLLVFATPSFSRIKKKSRAKQRYEQYQASAAHDQNLQTAKSESLNRMLKSSLVYLLMGISILLSSAVFFVLDAKYWNGTCFKFFMKGIQGASLDSFLSLTWVMARFIAGFVLPGYLFSALIFIPLISFVFGSKDNKDGSEKLSRESNRRRYRY